MRLVSFFIVLAVLAALNGCGGGGGGAGTDTVANPGTANTNTNVADTGSSGTGSTGTGSTGTGSTGTGSTGTGSTGTGSTGTGTAGTGTAGTDGIKQEMVAAINQARSVGRFCGATYYGAAASVAWDDRIAAAALKHTADMAANSFFSHTGSDGTSAGERLTGAGYGWSAYGENLAVGYSSAAAAVQSWLGSEGHCKNIMGPGYTEIGAAAVDGTYNGTPSMRYWTLDLGRPS